MREHEWLLVFVVLSAGSSKLLDLRVCLPTKTERAIHEDCYVKRISSAAMSLS